MKILVAMLALVVVLGSQPSAIRTAPVSETKLEKIVRNLSEILGGSFITVGVKSFVFSISDFGQAVIEPYKMFMNHLRTELPREITEDMDVLLDVPGTVVERPLRTFLEIDRRASPDSRAVLEAMIIYLDPKLESVTSFVAPVLEPLKAKLTEIDGWVNEKLLETLQYLNGHLSFYAKERQEARATLERLVDNAMEPVRQGMESLGKDLKPYLQLFLEIQKYKPEFEEWKTSPVLPPQKEV